MSEQAQKRNYFRIRYTPGSCPFFKFSGHNFQVIDISEQGFKFSMLSTKGLKEEMLLSGSLNFRDGESFLVHGTVKRLTEKEVSVQLRIHLPLRKIVAEQRLQIQRDKQAS